MVMKKYIYVILTIGLFIATTETANAEDNILLSDDYFKINAVNNEIVDEGVLSIKPSPNWTLNRERENELIEESSLNENSADGIITQAGMAPAKNNNDGRKNGPLPKTLKVGHSAQAIPRAYEAETSLGDWIFDFPK